MLLITRTNKLGLTAWSIFIALVFSGCADKIKTNLIAFRELNESLVRSNEILQSATENYYRSLQDKLADPITVEKAKIWEAKAARVKVVSSNMISHLDALKLMLMEEAGSTGNNSFKEGDKSAVMRLFAKKRIGRELYDKLQKCRKDLLTVDETMSSQLNTSLTFISASFDSSGKDQDDFIKTFFEDIPAIAAMAMLSKLQCNIVITENKMAEFCHDQVGSIRRHYYSYLGFAAINNGCAVPNEQVEITAAIVALNRAALPIITINGKDVPVNTEGVALHKFNASDKPGKHIVRVKLSYTGADGSQREMIKEVEYTVIAK
jgi:GldM N-terminal domain